ncbi:MAG: hypothetical protein AVDCRST_MAG18-1278 [uncultured Thermomicrobiales bacterium]|uniref:DUF4260 domain-containing protein n=1 Tax=uncultured Thermomicrobiales bacterium TaxID=1645740 RepID=A0A6J4UXI8_9BACT|nr:MAG: hypothetical protein AVDCRST_MAG18-1278 [uncultured Thermomicrobiales bacterium]
MGDGLERLLRPATLAHLEGAIVLLCGVLFYRQLGASWLLFALLLLAPDLAALGYVAGPRIGAACYNCAHTALLPAALLAFGLLAGESLALALAAIWFAHIGIDRLARYGLKETPPTRQDMLSNATPDGLISR